MAAAVWRNQPAGHRGAPRLRLSDSPDAVSVDRLDEDEELYLDVAEDFAAIAKQPDKLDEVLTATQDKILENLARSR
jgi:hypothetical protein